MERLYKRKQTPARIYFYQSRKKSNDEFINECKNIHGDLYNYSKTIYSGSKSKVIITCKIHGDIEIVAQTHRTGAGCYKCGRVSTGLKNHEKLKKTQDEFIKQANFVHNNYYNYSLVDYQQARKKIKIICPIHGIFEQIPQSHLDGSGCNICNIQSSNLERLWLDSLNIPNNRDYRGVLLPIKIKKCLVDGYDPKTNIVYEFYGDFWHGNPKIYNPLDLNPVKNETFGSLYQKTLEKETIILNHGYTLVTMWESEFKK